MQEWKLINIILLLNFCNGIFWLLAAYRVIRVGDENYYKERARTLKTLGFFFAIGSIVALLAVRRLEPRVRHMPPSVDKPPNTLLRRHPSVERKASADLRFLRSAVLGRERDKQGSQIADLRFKGKATPMPLNHSEIIEDLEEHIRKTGGAAGEWWARN